MQVQHLFLLYMNLLLVVQDLSGSPVIPDSFSPGPIFLETKWDGLQKGPTETVYAKIEDLVVLDQQAIAETSWELCNPSGPLFISLMSYQNVQWGKDLS